jgi:hypothetical protein
MTYPVFASGDVLNASDMNGVGLWLVKSQTVGTGVGAVTVTGAFSADYDSYKIVYTGGIGSGGTINLTLGASAASYSNVLVFGLSYATPTASGVGTNNGAAWLFTGYHDANYALCTFELYGPFLAKYTGLSAPYMSDTNAGTLSGIHKVATSYSAFTLTAAAGGTLTGGTIKVYGYRN